MENAERRADLLAYIREFDLVPQSIFTLSFHLFIDALGEYAPGTLILVCLMWPKSSESHLHVQVRER